jgi:hypothetical protein
VWPASTTRLSRRVDTQHSNRDTNVDGVDMDVDMDVDTPPTWGMPSARAEPAC